MPCPVCRATLNRIETFLMPATVTRNPFETETVTDPVKADGSRYRFEMIFDQQRSRAYADTAAELVGVLVGDPTYDNATVEERAAVRVRWATDMLAPMQATVLASVDQSTLSETEREVLLQPRFSPVVVEEWASEVPLVLLDVHYVPFSDVPAPVSALEFVDEPRNIIWLRAAEDMDLLVSLHRIGFLSLGENNDFMV